MALKLVEWWLLPNIKQFTTVNLQKNKLFWLFYKFGITIVIWLEKHATVVYMQLKKILFTLLGNWYVLTATYEMVSQKLHRDFDFTSCHLSIHVGF